MNLKEQFESLRGCPIGMKAHDSDIPCREVSDPERLCKHPVVSVRMATYNHEPYIRQAVESVMMQITDFEYELIIGEDASQDKTREICFELQKKYPDRVRVLWSEDNVNKIGGNFRRIDARCRGEFLALLEGDDYWMDPHRLQKQVDVMRQYPKVVLCFGEQQNLDQTTGKITPHNAFRRQWPTSGVIAGENFADTDCLAAPFTSLVRASSMREVERRYDIFNWRLFLGDLQVPRALCNFGDIYLFHDIFATYRNHGGGVTKRLPTKVQIDAGIVRMYFAMKGDRLSIAYFLVGLCNSIRGRYFEIAKMKGFAVRNSEVKRVAEGDLNRIATVRFVGVFGVLLVRFGFSKILDIYLRACDKFKRICI